MAFGLEWQQKHHAFNNCNLCAMQHIHKGQQPLRMPLFEIEPIKWLIDPLHELINVVDNAFGELIHAAISHSVVLLAAVTEVLAHVGINLSRKLEKLTKRADANQHINVHAACPAYLCRFGSKGMPSRARLRRDSLAGSIGENGRRSVSGDLALRGAGRGCGSGRGTSRRRSVPGCAHLCRIYSARWSSCTCISRSCAGA